MFEKYITTSSNFSPLLYFFNREFYFEKYILMKLKNYFFHINIWTED